MLNHHNMAAAKRAKQPNTLTRSPVLHGNQVETLRPYYRVYTSNVM